VRGSGVGVGRVTQSLAGEVVGDEGAVDVAVVGTGSGRELGEPQPASRTATVPTDATPLVVRDDLRAMTAALTRKCRTRSSLPLDRPLSSRRNWVEDDDDGRINHFRGSSVRSAGP
jgi:hypothetical protein